MRELISRCGFIMKVLSLVSKTEHLEPHPKGQIYHMPQEASEEAEGSE